jgi:hypothetical protein
MNNRLTFTHLVKIRCSILEPHGLTSIKNAFGSSVFSCINYTFVCCNMSFLHLQVLLCVTPRSEGELQILGIAYQMSNPAAQQSAESSNITPHTISVPGKQVFNLRKPRPKSTKDRGSQDLHDRRLEISVVKSAPLLQVNYIS